MKKITVKDINKKITDIDASIRSLNLQIIASKMSDGMGFIKDLVHRKNKLEEEKKELEELEINFYQEEN